MVKNVEDIMRVGPVIPVVTLESMADASPLADALLAGGIRTIEVTLRTTVALKAVALLAKESKHIVVGAGTVTTPELYQKVVDAGVQFIVSPGLTDGLARESQKHNVPFLPGVTTTSEVMRAADHGFRFLKFFPAELSGGTKALKNFSALFKDIKFCPTGGVEAATMNDYLALPNVLCVGGSWLTPTDALKAKDWTKITKIARDTLASVKPK